MLTQAASATPAYSEFRGLAQWNTNLAKGSLALCEQLAQKLRRKSLHTNSYFFNPLGRTRTKHCRDNVNPETPTPTLCGCSQ